MVDYEADAQALREAIKGSGTDEDTIINLTASRSNSERLEIRKTYKASFGTDLIDDLNDDLGGNFGKVVVSMYLSPVEYDVSELRKAMEGAGSEEGTLSEIIGSRTNTRLKQILSLYKLKYDEDLEERIKSECSGDYGNLLVALLQCKRAEGNIVDSAAVQNDVEALYKAGEGKWGTDEETFIRIFALRNSSHLKKMNELYVEQKESQLLDVVESEFSGDIKILLQTILHSHINPADYYATRIYKACKGFGTDEEAVTRSLVVMDEVFLPQLTKIYKAKYGRTLQETIDEECSGDYKRMLMALMDSPSYQ
jgi:hypothetical protein